MNFLNNISERITHLKSGEHVTISAQELLISRADFQSVLVYLKHESKKGDFLIQDEALVENWFDRTSLTINKI